MRLRACAAALGGVLLASCANGVPGHFEPPSAQPSASDAPQTVAPSNGATQPNDASAMLDELLAGASSGAAPSTEAHERRAAAFLTMPDAAVVLRRRYERLRPDEMGRWSYANLAAKVANHESLTFLEDIAYAEVPASPALGDDVEMARYRAVSGIVGGYLAGSPGYDTALIKLLSTADTGLARRAGVELFSRGKLDEEHAALLTERGIYSRFTKTDGPPPALEPLAAQERSAP